jgi:hypothetical protein
VKLDPEKGMTSSAKERDCEEMVREGVSRQKWEQIYVKKAYTCPDEAALDATTTPSAAKPTTGTTTETPPPGLTKETICLTSDKSIALFGSVYNRPTLMKMISKRQTL